MASPATRSTDDLLLDEVLAFARDERTDLAFRLVELHALRAEGEIDDEEFARRRLGLHA